MRCLTLRKVCPRKAKRSVATLAKSVGHGNRVKITHALGERGYSKISPRESAGDDGSSLAHRRTCDSRFGARAAPSG